MEIKITHGKVCQKAVAIQTKTPIPIKDGPDSPVPTITLNFHVGSIHSEEILSISAAKELMESLQNIFSNSSI